jgi:hypothetical protein
MPNARKNREAASDDVKDGMVNVAACCGGMWWKLLGT